MIDNVVGYDEFRSDFDQKISVVGIVPFLLSSAESNPRLEEAVKRRQSE